MKTPGPGHFNGEFFQNFKEEITAVLFKFFRRIETAETLSNLFYEAIITLRPKSNKEITRGK